MSKESLTFPLNIDTDNAFGNIGKNFLEFTLTSAITISATSFTVNEAITNFPSNGYVVIGEEVIYYDSKDNDTKTFSSVERGQDGSTASTHEAAEKGGMAVIKLHVEGLRDAVQNIETNIGLVTSVTSSTYSILSTDGVILGNTTSNAITLTLPDASSYKNKKYIIKKIIDNGNNIIVNTTSSQTIDGVTSLTITTYNDGVALISDGSNWKKIGSNLIPSVGTTTATLVSVDVSSFTSQLSSADNTVQKALNTLDQHTHDGKVHTHNTDTILTTDGITKLIDSGILENNLTVCNLITIDGRDLSIDGSKLDGIECNAVSLSTVKADSDIADALNKKHTSGSDNQNVFTTFCGDTGLIEAITQTENIKIIGGVGIDTVANDSCNTISISNTDLGSSAVTTHESTYNHSLLHNPLTIEDSNSINLSICNQLLSADLLIQDTGSLNLEIDGSGLKGIVLANGVDHNLLCNTHNLTSDLQPSWNNITDIPSTFNPTKHLIDSTTYHCGIVGIENNFLGINSNGLPKDSGYKAGDFDGSGTAQGLINTHECTYIHSDISLNTASRHTQNTDTTLKNGSDILICNGNIYNNITVTNGKTIDGRDISADGLKLDSIECSAVSLSTVKSDTDIASAISLKHASGSDNQNLFSMVCGDSGTLIEADSQTDLLNILGGDGISTSTNGTIDTLTIVNDDKGSTAVSSHECTYNHSLLHTRLHSVNNVLDHTGVSGATECNFISFNTNCLFQDSGYNAETLSYIQNGDGAGILQEPTLTDNLDGTVQVSEIEVLIRSTSDHTGGILYKKTVPADTSLILTNNTVNYIYADWNSGNPIYKATTDRDLINNSNIIPVYRVYMNTNSITYKLSYGEIAAGQSAKDFERVMRLRGTGGIERESGLVLSEISTRVVNVSGGYVWFGLERLSLDTIIQGGDGVSSELWYHSSGNWAHTNITEYNNTQYDNGTNLVTLTANRYGVNWIFRNIVTNEIDIVLGNGDYTLAQAEASTIPTLPAQISNFYLLVGRIIVQKNASTATAIENISTTVFNQTIVSEHNNLGGLQGGTTSQYYHLTSTEHSNSHAPSSDNQNIFNTVCGDTGSIIANSQTDFIKIIGSTGISTIANDTSNTVTLTNTDTGSSAINSHISTYDHTKLHDRLHSITCNADHSGVIGASENNFISFDSNCLPKDSGYNVNSFSLYNHNHCLNNLVEKSYNSLTDKPVIPSDLNDLGDVIISNPQDDESLIYCSGCWINKTSSVSADEKVKVSSNDLTAGYLNGKIVNGAGINLIECNNGGNETFYIINTDLGSSAVTTHTSTYDHTKLHDRLHSINCTADHSGISGATENNFISFDVNCLPKDSGKKASDFEVTGTALNLISCHEGCYIHTDISLNTAARHNSGSDNQNVFTIICGDTGSNILASSQNDKFSILGGSGIDTSIDCTLKTITIVNSDLGSSAVSTHESTYDHTKIHDAATVQDSNSINLTICNQQITADLIIQDTSSIDLTIDGSGLKGDVLETGVDHNLLCNTHNLTTDINHNSLTNTHNLTTDLQPVWSNISSKPSTFTPILHEIADPVYHCGIIGVECNFMGIDANGFPSDSGSKSSDFATASHNHTGVYEPVITTLAINKGGTNNTSYTSNKFLVYDGSKINASGYDCTILGTRLIQFTFDGDSSEITAGKTAHVKIPYDAKINNWELTADQSGCIKIDLWKDTYNNFPPTVADSITNSHEPSLVGTQKAQDTDLSDWTTTDICSGDYLMAYVCSVTTLTFAHLSINVTIK